MAIDIASMTAQQKLDFANAVGSIKLAGGSISSPVSYLDLILPAAYSLFVLKLVGFTMSVADVLAGAFSTDGGATFICDPSNYDSYGGLGWHVTGTGGSDTPGADNFSNPLMSLCSGNDPTERVDASFEITLKSGDTPIVSGIASGPNQVNYLSPHQLAILSNWLRPDATIPPTYERPNVLRILPFGNGDCDPPTSGRTLTGGSYTLLGAV